MGRPSSSGPGIFGSVKNDAAQNLTRGTIRVMGLAKTALLTLFAVMAANLRLLDTWHARQTDTAVAPVQRRPRRRTRLSADTPTRLATAHARRALLEAVSSPPPAPPDDPFLVTFADALEPDPPPRPQQE